MLPEILNSSIYYYSKPSLIYYYIKYISNINIPKTSKALNEMELMIEDCLDLHFFVRS